MKRWILRALRVTLGVVVVIAGLVPAVASAAVTRTAITTPANPYYGQYAQATGPFAPEQFTVTGTSNGTTGDKVDLWCGDSRRDGIAGPVPVAANGTFTTQVSADSVGGIACRLRAVPEGYRDADLDAFPGNLLALTAYEEDRYRTPVRAATAQRPTSFEVLTGHRRGKAAVLAAARLGLAKYRGVRPDTLRAYPEATWESTGFIGSVSGPMTAFTVDGRASYGGTSVPRFDYDGPGPMPTSAPAGFTGIGSSVTVDPKTGDTYVFEVEQVTRCAESDAPRPIVTQCKTLLPTGVRHERATTFTREHSLVTVRDAWISTDGVPHGVRVEAFQEAVEVPAPVWRFPGETAFAPLRTGDVRRPAQPGTVLVRDRNGDNSQDVAAGGFTFTPAPTAFTFLFPEAMTDVTELAVPAVGELKTERRFAVAPTVAGVEEILNGPAAPRPVPPGLVVSSPVDGLGTTAAAVVVAGNVVADDQAGLSLTVNGRAVGIAADRSFRTSVALNKGANAITVRLSGRGDPVSRTLNVIRLDNSYPVRRCVVPAVRRGATLRSAQRALGKAGCRAARTVRKVRSAKVRKGHVVGLGRRARTVLPPGTKIAIRVSAGRKPR